MDPFFYMFFLWPGGAGTAAVVPIAGAGAAAPAEPPPHDYGTAPTMLGNKVSRRVRPLPAGAPRKQIYRDCYSTTKNPSSNGFAQSAAIRIPLPRE